MINHHRPVLCLLAAWLVLCRLSASGIAAEAPSLYGIHDHAPDPSEYLNHIKNDGTAGWVTATVAVGTNTNDISSVNFTTSIASQGNTVICRLNYGYYPDGTIPLPAQYNNFATRCANFVSHSTGCNIWIIGNETNLGAEWPWDGSRFNYLSPQDYANCFRKVYDAIKAVRPNDKILSQGIAPWAGPYGAGMQNVNGTNYPTDGQPLTWVQYLNQMLTAITNSGPLDGIGIHNYSRGYNYADIHSTNKFGALNLYASFYSYKDWVDYGIPPALYNLPLYITECNGLNYWKGGGPPGEDPGIHYQAGWMQEIYAEINRYNQSAATNGKPIFRCVNMYRWCNGCDGWNIDAASDTYKAQILSDLDAAVAQHYIWPTNVIPTIPPPAPAGLTSQVSTGKVTLNWNSARTAASYTVKRSTTSGGPYTTIASNLIATTFDNTFFNTGTTYYYIVSAANVAGEGPNSNQTSATPTNGLPDVVVSAIGWSPTPIYLGSNVVFRATMLNQGSAPTPPGITLGVGFLVDGIQVSFSGGYSSSLPVGGSITLNADGGPNGGAWPATIGTHTIAANADDINRFPESLENNNAASGNFVVFATNYSINAGGPATGSFTADTNFSGGTSFTVTNSINPGTATNPAPAAVYQSERWGNSSYSFSYLVPGNDYSVRLHFAEISPSVNSNGDRQFNVSINGSQVLTNFDIVAVTGGKFRATTRQFNTLADNSGQIVIQFQQGPSNQPKVSAIEIFASAPAPVLAAIPARTINEGSTLRFNALAYDPQPGQLITDFEGFPAGTPVLFQKPAFSATTSGFLDATPNVLTVTNAFPSGIPGSRALNVQWSYKTGIASQWLRLTTFGATNLPNPTLDFSQALRFDIYSDKDIALGLGVRETSSANSIGGDGGTTGSIEFVGVTNKNGTIPLPVRTIPGGAWTTIQFNIPFEAITSFSAGDGILQSSTGKGVLEHLGFLPAAGLGTYNVFLDNFVALPASLFSYSLGNAPPGAVINPTNGLFTWTPTEAQGPGSYDITVYLTKNNNPWQADAKMFTVTVNEVNQSPALAIITNRTINAGATLTFTNSATDPDLPANTLNFNLDPGAPSGAAVGTTNGVFSWTTPQTVSLQTNSITVRVTDNGSPALSEARTFNVIIIPPPRFLDISGSGGGLNITWQTFPGKTYRVQYKNNLIDSNWTTLGSDTMGSGSTLSALDSTGNSPQRFYRIVQLN